MTYALFVRRTSASATSSTTYAVINYSLVGCGTGLLDEWGIAILDEVYRSFGLPTAPHVTVSTYIRGLQVQ
ncbi:hypothetical protein [Nostoc sp.]|uniref:hypothetical protein n=1 Tax=Nostoc sp. TaxID=1180 RepID=UPI003FA53157